MPYGVNPITGRPGPAPKPPRDGDKIQARQRINVQVRRGERPHPDTLPRTDCGHVRKDHTDRRHQYDHFLGYAPEHHYDVQPVCVPCHGKRALARGEIDIANLKRAAARRAEVRKTHCALGHPMTRGSDGGWRCRTCRLVYWRKRNAQRQAHG